MTGAGGLNQTPTATYANNINAGTATASYTYAGDANHTGSNDYRELHHRPEAGDVDDQSGEQGIRGGGPAAADDGEWQRLPDGGRGDGDL